MESIAYIQPVIVHFPVALFVIYALFELSSLILKSDTLSKGAHIILALAVVTSIGAVLTGNQAEEVAKNLFENKIELPTGILEAHEEYATLMLWYFFAILGLRTYFVLRKKFVPLVKIGIAVLALAGLFFVYQTGAYGGQLVYKYGIGTEILKESSTE